MNDAREVSYSSVEAHANRVHLHDLERICEGSWSPYRQEAMYSERGDSIRYLSDDRAYNADWVAPFLTLYFDVKTGGVIGFKLKCVRALTRIMKEGGNPVDSVQLKDVVGRAFEAWKHDKELGDREEWTFEQERQVIQLLRSDLANVLVGPELAKAA